MKIVKPSVSLMRSGKADLAYVYAGYRRCYSDKEYPEITNYEKMEKFVSRMRKCPHETPLEQAEFIFHVTCSRSCSHQLVRHRLASVNQQSQRYVKIDHLPVIIPPAVYGSEPHQVVHDNFFSIMELAEKYYETLVKEGVKPEDAQYVLPNATATYIQVKMNCRELLHFFSERCCTRAQWEIRAIANQMLALCKQELPCIFDDTAGPKCQKLRYCPETESCGRMKSVKEIQW